MFPLCFSAYKMAPFPSFLHREHWALAIPPAATRIAAVRHESSESAKPKGEALWVDSKGELPPGAVEGGYEDVDGKRLTCYVGRAVFGKALIPGKVCPWDGCIFIGLNDEEHQIYDFQVLVKGHWVKTTALNIPPNAVPAGYRERNSKIVPLYIGRVKYGDAIIIGKVHEKGATDGEGCWFPCNGKQLNCNNYEIFCA